MPKNKPFSPETIKRLSIYLRNLKRLQEKNVDIISSDKITTFLNVTPEQFRKDLSFFGEFGKRGVGYQVSKLIAEIEVILGINKQWDIVLAGVGRLGSALLGFDGFSRFNLKISCAFDADPKRVGTKVEDVEIFDIKDLKRIIQQKAIKMGIIATPPESAQSIADQFIEAGIKGILNFSPLILRVPKNVFISNVDMACELESLIFFVKE